MLFIGIVVLITSTGALNGEHFSTISIGVSSQFPGFYATTYPTRVYNCLRDTPVSHSARHAKETSTNVPEEGVLWDLKGIYRGMSMHGVS